MSKSTTGNDRHASVRVLFVDDDERLRTVLTDQIGDMGFQIESAASVPAARSLLAAGDYDVVLLDLHMPKMGGQQLLSELPTLSPGTEAIILTGNADLETAIECMKQGAYDFLTKPCQLDRLEVVLEKAAEKRQLRTRFRSMNEARTVSRPLGESLAFQEVRDLVARIAPTDEPVLILGESGTGKELLAHEIVRRSQRAGEPFITVNCSALSDSLLESELFGHEKGAFTGATQKRMGVFHLADGGTIFLDEIGDMPAAMQVKILRTLQSGEIRPVGAHDNIYVDVRVIAATNQDLERLVEEERFRGDLLFRLNTFTLRLPPLRERPGDVELLAESMLANYRARSGREVALTPEAMALLRSYAWPGNIRELENVVKRAAVLAAGELITAGDLPGHLRDGVRETDNGIDLGEFSSEELDKLHLKRMLTACGGNKRETARRMGISPKTLYNKIQTYGIDTGA